ncbi:hypothetical protein IEQ34_016616 [Dendrobium chrysotoxum]|uniref:Uncharacterized protein n=1 Tax=Dendrobium chrysotoxum TaxID=161865 RepID=A0AAV7GER8_DENCH|nr:hypothetical protein IEQ34_016616 [Dendrobium chrysotoxum]
MLSVMTARSFSSTSSAASPICSTLSSTTPLILTELCIRHLDGSPISSEIERQRVIHSSQRLKSIREFCEQIIDLRILTEATRTFRENGLSVTRAEVPIKEDMAGVQLTDDLPGLLIFVAGIGDLPGLFKVIIAVEYLSRGLVPIEVLDDWIDFGSLDSFSKPYSTSNLKVSDFIKDDKWYVNPLLEHAPYNSTDIISDPINAISNDIPIFKFSKNGAFCLKNLVSFLPSAVIERWIVAVLKLAGVIEFFLAGWGHRALALLLDFISLAWGFLCWDYMALKV